MRIVSWTQHQDIFLYSRTQVTYAIHAVYLHLHIRIWQMLLDLQCILHYGFVSQYVQIPGIKPMTCSAMQLSWATEKLYIENSKKPLDILEYYETIFGSMLHLHTKILKVSQHH